MRCRLVLTVRVLTVLLTSATVWLVPAPTIGQTTSPGRPWTAPRTPWGDPDLQGIWTANEMHSVPLERVADLAGNATLSDEAAAERREQTTQRTVNAEGIGNYDRAFRDTALGYTKQVPSTQMSLIVEPPDGKLPPLTPEEQRRSRPAGSPVSRGASLSGSSWSSTPVTRGTTPWSTH